MNLRRLTVSLVGALSLVLSSGLADAALCRGAACLPPPAPVPLPVPCTGQFCAPVNVLPRWVAQTRKSVAARHSGRVYGEVIEDLVVNGQRTARFKIFSTFTARRMGVSMTIGDTVVECNWDGSRGFTQPAISQVFMTKGGPRLYQYADGASFPGNAAPQFPKTCVPTMVYAMRQKGISLDNLQFFQKAISNAHPTPTAPLDPINDLRAPQGVVTDGDPTWNGILDAAYGGLALGFGAIAGMATAPEEFATAVALGALCIGIGSYEKAQLAGQGTLPMKPELAPGGTEPGWNKDADYNSTGWDDGRDLHNNDGDGGAPADGSSSDPAVPAENPLGEPVPPTTTDPNSPNGPGGCAEPPPGNGNRLWCETGPIE